MSDLIERKDLGAAIDNWLAIDRYYHPYSKQKTIPVSELVDIIKLLPSAQRTGSCEYWDSESGYCALSKPSAQPDYDLSGYSDRLWKAAYERGRAEAQRKGRWIKNDNDTYSCDQCHSWIPNEQHYYARYCIFCGARMEEQE